MENLACEERDLRAKDGEYRALTVPEIKEIVQRFGETAYLSWKAGYDGVQV